MKPILFNTEMVQVMGDIDFGTMYKHIGYLNNYTMYKITYNLYKYEL